MFKQILKKSFTIGLATFVSRVLGFLRDILIAFFFGTGYAAQAFVVAFRLPNIWRSFIGEEAVNASVVPVLSEHRSRDDLLTFQSLSKSLIKSSFIILAVLTLLGVLFAPVLVRLIAPGFISDFQQYSLSVKLTRIMFPYILFIGLTAMLAGIAITQKVFWSYSWAPAALNISIIFFLLAMKRYGVYALALGIIAGGIVELIMQVFALKGRGIYRIRAPLFHPEYKKIWKLLVPRFFGAGIYHINIFIDTILGSLQNIVGTGAIAALYYAQRFVQLPLAVFATSLATAVLPFFSAQATQKGNSSIRDNLLSSLRLVAFIMIPSTIGFFLLSKEIISVVFQRGSFSAYSAGITSSALRFYSLGLVFYAGIKLLVATFYSLQNTLTPVKISALALFINVVLSVALMFPLGLSGLCLATSIAAGCNFMLLFVRLNKTLYLYDKDFFKSIAKIIFSSAAMGLVLVYMKYMLSNRISHDILLLIILILASSVSYGVLSILFNKKDIKVLLRWKRAG
ncbi:MAG: murein biosynthesis integral membrane protein MurJ [Candidatus Omnitrophica bacterium]|nr:murein biosynthesis integral membrane protein MurJ [Candidatus Omnitrophota bacterium]